MHKSIIILCVVFISLNQCVVSQGITSGNKVITGTDLYKAGSTIDTRLIGEPVSSVKLYEPRWVDASGESPAYGIVEGSIFPVDPDGWPINFRILLPASWSHRSIQYGGGGMNGIITVREGRNPMINKGFAIYGSDSGHQVSGMNFQGGTTNNPFASGPTTGNEWALNEEAIKNLGYMQMKKTHDAAMVIIKRIYGEKPAYNYYIGNSQGGREGLTVAQRYPADYDGVISNVPIVSFSTLMLAPELIRIQEKARENWITPAKINVIKAEFMRQCDGLDGILDGIISNYNAARTIFNVNDGKGPSDPWASLRVVNGVDPNPEDYSVNAKLTDGQIKTLELSYSSYKFASPLANGVTTFGMWLPTTEPNGFGMITGIRYKGQEGAGTDALIHTSLGILGVTGFLMQDINANPLDYIEGGKWNKRREEISEWLDSTNPDLSEFYKKGGKMIITIGSIDNVASCGAQLGYYQSLLDEMGRKKVDEFARLYVVPQAGHGLSGKSSVMNGEGKPVTLRNIPAPNNMDNVDLIINWVEKNEAPAKTLVIDEQGHIKTQQAGKGYLMCSYPNYQKYVGGPSDEVTSYISAEH